VNRHPSLYDTHGIRMRYLTGGAWGSAIVCAVPAAATAPAATDDEWSTYDYIMAAMGFL
jgi:hypothetical protein